MDDFMLEEFKLEAFELIDEAEDALLKLESNEDFDTCFNSIFRCFHSIKGGAGMFGIKEIQSFMHTNENLIETYKETGEFPESLISFLLSAMDQVKAFMDGKDYNFSIAYNTNEVKNDVKQEEATIKEDSAQNVTPIETKKKEKEQKEKYDALVYLVDDEEDILEMLEVVLEAQTNFKIEKFNNPEDALEAFSKKNPDLVITDLSMPQMTGLELIKKLSHINQLVPAIILSGFVTKDSCMEALSYGAAGILEKPCEMKLLISQANHAIKRYQSFKLFNRSIDLLTYQFEEFDKWLGENNSSERDQFRRELKNLLNQKKELYKKAA